MVSIRPKGAIRLNAEATNLLRSKGVVRVLILWDRDKHKLALSIAPDGDKRAYRVTYSSRGSSATIGAKSFGAFIGFSADRAVSLPADYQGGMLQATVPVEYLNKGVGHAGKEHVGSRKKRPDF